LDSIEYVSLFWLAFISSRKLTKIVNAASKGHLPVVLYLLSKQSADPLVRNNWGETAYDMAAAVFEVWICEVRQSNYHEAECVTS
jgi:hypothetical protein